MSKLKILHLLTSKTFSGAENVVCQIIDIFRDEYDMVYCSVFGPIEEELKNRDISFNGLKEFKYSEVKRVINHIKPDIIHAHDIRASIIASLFTKHCTVISHIHGNHDNMNKYTIKSILYRLIASKFKHIFWVSDSAINQYKFSSKVQGNSSVLYNVINIDELIRKKESDSNTYDYDVVYLGRLSYPKNPERLIKIFEKVYNKLPETRFAIIGDGNLKKQTEDLARKLEIDKNVDFLGFMSNPFKILSDSKVMVMTSRYEGTPMCALEGMSLGVPIVSTPTDGLKEVVVNGETGYLSNDDKELVAYICRLVSEKSINSKFKEKSEMRSRLINDIKNYKQELERVYKDNEL